MCVCVYVCMSECVCVYVCVCMYARVCMWVCDFLSLYLIWPQFHRSHRILPCLKYAWQSTNLAVCVCVCACVCVCVYVYVCM